MSELLNTPSSLPVLPSSLRSSFTSLSGVTRGIVRGYMHRVYLSVWPFRTHLHPSTAPMSLIFLLPGVLTRLGLNISEVAALSAVYFLSEGGKRGILTAELLKTITMKRPYDLLSKLQHAGYLTRSHFDPSDYTVIRDRYTQKRFILITGEGVQLLRKISNAFRSDFYGVINRAAFGPENCNNKKPGPTK
ncbi:MAG TPA: hypothetical protein ENH85_02595 [Candidatus Scalindua sp.]|nr:hypothetical protein [Candidatus Scalindua sp.]